MDLCLGDGGGKVEKLSLFNKLEKLWSSQLGKAIKPATRRALDGAWKKWESWTRMAKQDLPGIDLYNPTLEVVHS